MPSAAYCLEIAQEFEDRGRKIALLNMAQTWIALADRVEKAGDAPRIGAVVGLERHPRCRPDCPDPFRLSDARRDQPPTRDLSSK